MTAENAQAPTSEAAVLGCMLLHPDVAEWVNVEDRDFFDMRHRAVWESLRGVVSDNAGIADIGLVENSLKRAGRLDAVGGLAFLAELADRACVPSVVEHHVAELRRARITREVLILAGEVRGWAERGVEGEELLTELLRGAGGIDVGGNDAPYGWRDMMLREHKAVEEHFAQDERSCFAGVPTGIAALDDLTGGLPIGKLTIAAARPSVGKSSLVQQVGRNALSAGYPVHHLSYEDGAQDYAQREIADESGIDVSRIRARQLETAHEIGEVTRATERIAARTGMLFDEAHGRTVHWLCRRVRAWRRRHGTRLVIVDYVGRMPPPRPRMRKREAIEANVCELVELAAREQLAVVLVSQLSREVDRRADRGDGTALPVLADLAESGSLEQAGKLILMLHEVDQENLAILVRKNHQGPTGRVDCTFDRARCRIRG